MQSLNSSTIATTVVQNPSKSELHMVKAKHNKKVSAMEDKSSGHQGQIKNRSCNCFEALQAHPKKDFPVIGTEH